jgi:hypothetical protein
MNFAKEWSHKDEWRRSGEHFLVVVSRHAVQVDEEFGEGPHIWCVYAYIYPEHPHFAAFNGPHMWQDAASMMPFHRGPSYLDYPTHEGKVTSVKVGADYNHLYDDRFTHYATAEDAYSVFSDAQDLHYWLTAKSMKETAPVESETA